MAEAFFNRAAKARGLTIRAKSAGTMGSGVLNPTVVVAMGEVGVTMADHSPKALTQGMADQAFRTISMGCGVDADACPAQFLVTEDWGLDDPAGQPLKKVRVIRDEIEKRVGQLIEELS